MKSILLLILLTIPAMAQTNYVVSVDGGRVDRVGSNFAYDGSVLTVGDSKLCGMNWSSVRVSYYVGALPVPFTQTNQVDDLIVLLPPDLDPRRQTLKPTMQKVMENNYVKFLTNDWTTVLRAYQIIPATNTITVQNTDSAQNTMYLIELQGLDTGAFTACMSFFTAIKAQMKDAFNADLVDCVWHPEVANLMDKRRHKAVR